MLYMRAIQGDSRGNRVDPSLQDNVEIPYNRIEYIHHVDSSQDCHSVFQSGLLAEENDTKEGIRTVFFTAVDPMNEPQRDEPYDVKEPRDVLCRTKSKVHQK